MAGAVPAEKEAHLGILETALCAVALCFWATVQACDLQFRMVTGQKDSVWTNWFLVDVTQLLNQATAGYRTLNSEGILLLTAICVLISHAEREREGEDVLEGEEKADPQPLLFDLKDSFSMRCMTPGRGMRKPMPRGLLGDRFCESGCAEPWNSYLTDPWGLGRMIYWGHAVEKQCVTQGIQCPMVIG